MNLPAKPTEFYSRTFQALVAPLPVPAFLPAYHYAINDFMLFEMNYATIMGIVYLAYYFTLEPVAAVSWGYAFSFACLKRASPCL